MNKIFFKILLWLLRKKPVVIKEYKYISSYDNNGELVFKTKIVKKKLETRFEEEYYFPQIAVQTLSYITKPQISVEAISVKKGKTYRFNK